MKLRSIRDFLSAWDAGQFASGDSVALTDAGCESWHCSDEEMHAKVATMVPVVRALSLSEKVDDERMVVVFKHGESGRCYFNLAIPSRAVPNLLVRAYSVAPFEQTATNGTHLRPEVWGRENEFDKPLDSGSLSAILDFFGVEESACERTGQEEMFAPDEHADPVEAAAVFLRQAEAMLNEATASRDALTAKLAALSDKVAALRFAGGGLLGGLFGRGREVVRRTANVPTGKPTTPMNHKGNYDAEKTRIEAARKRSEKS